jgi:Domain of unknown function (DUF4907)
MKRGLIFLFKYSAAISTFTIISISFFSCGPVEDTTKYNVCHCSGSKLTELNNERGVVVSTTKGYLIISESLGYLKLCDGIPDEFKTNGFPLISFSGKTIPTCLDTVKTTSATENGVVYPQNSRHHDIKISTVEMQAISHIDTINRIGDVSIKVFYSTNGGGFTGWGYEVEKEGFKLHQDEIPGLPGTEQFATKEEAMAFAVLVAFKLNTINDFPSVTTGDLCMLGKLVCTQN